MTKYFYKAKNLKGEEETGVLEAKDESQLSRALYEKGYILISAEREGAKEKEKKSKQGVSLSFGGPSLSEKMFFTRNLQVMVKTGVPLPRAVSLLSAQTKSRKMAGALSDISSRIEKGESFSSALRSYPKIFPEIYTAGIEVGEESGHLEEILATLAFQMEREHDLRSKVKAAMVYPAIIVVVAIGVAILMLAFVFPKVVKIFEEFSIELPLTTRVIFVIVAVLEKNWWSIPLLAGFFIFIFFLFFKSKSTRKLRDKMFLKLPFFAGISKQLNTALALRSLSSLLSAGVPIVRTLEVSSRALSNYYFKISLIGAAKSVKKGTKLSEGLEAYPNLYPSLVLQMIKVGEETGESAEILGKLASFYEEELSNTFKKLSSLIEPILILALGAGIGFFAISMLQPMFSMMGSL